MGKMRVIFLHKNAALGVQNRVQFAWAKTYTQTATHGAPSLPHHSPTLQMHTTPVGCRGHSHRDHCGSPLEAKRNSGSVWP